MGVLQIIGIIHNASAWDISSATYSGKSFLFSAQNTTPSQIFFRPDGSTMYITESQADDINQYALSTSWDISTASYTQTKRVTEPEGVSAFFISSDGSNMYVGGSGNDNIYQYTLSTPWDVSTASAAGKTLSTGAQDSSLAAMAFNTDGSKLYTGGGTDNKVYQYTLSTPWDISTGGYANKSYGTTVQGQALEFSSDGSKMYAGFNASEVVTQYTLSTPWDVSTASAAGKTLDVTAQDTYPTSCRFSVGGTIFYMVGSTNNKVYQYNL